MSDLPISQRANNDLQNVFWTSVRDASVNDDAVVNLAQGSFRLGDVTSLTVGVPDNRGNLFQRASQTAANNSVRSVFLRMVSDVFGGESRIPETVRKAMNLDRDFDGGGRPLKVRHIRATMSAINTYFDSKTFKGLDVLTHGKHNLGQLRLDADGVVKVTNNHHIRFLRNFSSVTPEENRAVREKVAQMLLDEFAGTKDGVKAQLAKFRIKQFFSEAKRDEPLVRADVGRLIDELKTQQSLADAADVDSMLANLGRMGKVKGKFLSLGSEMKVSNEKPTQEENKATRVFLIKLIDSQGATGGHNPVISAAKLILSHDLMKEITHDEVVDLLEKVQQSRQNSPTVQRECENIAVKQGKIRADILQSLTNVSEIYDNDLKSRNEKNKTNLISQIKPGKVFRAIESLNPCIQELKKNGVDVLGMVKKWGTARQMQKTAYTGEREKLINDTEKEFEDLGMATDVLRAAFPIFKDRTQDLTSVEITMKFWQMIVDNPDHNMEFLNEDAVQLGTWHAQKKMADELIDKYMPGVNVVESSQKTKSVIDVINTISDIEAKIRENNGKIDTLKSKARASQQIERPSSQSDDELKNCQEAHDYIISALGEGVDWGKAKTDYAGGNTVIKDLLSLFADEDDETVDDLVCNELSSLATFIDERTIFNSQSESVAQQDVSKKELEKLTQRKADLEADLTVKTTLLAEQKRTLPEGLEDKDIIRQNVNQNEFLAIQQEGMKYQKYSTILKSA